jgi:(1->4)-alpha-D-glucan 1-alpha-D-glucosylmutase
MRTPASTYRLQLTSSFTLFDAAEVVPYLADLGVDWVYLSPILEAEEGSEHGYDVLRHDRVDASRGGAEGLAALSAAAREHGLGVLVDIVPNHVGVASPVPGTWWWDVLQHGASSRYADHFDIDWEAGGGKVLWPVVGDDDAGSIEVDAGEGVVRYHDFTLPMAPGTSTLEEQHYELASWRRADSDLNYRRFFTVKELAGIRVEDPEVFDASHVEIKRWFDEGLVDGLRVDHPDGLRDPVDYLDRLAELTGGAYVLVEKILEPGEALPTSWATAGTTGYDAMALVDRVLTDPAPGLPLLPEGVDFHDMVHDTKRAVTDHGLRAEVRRIVRELAPVVEQRAPASVVETPALEDAVAELLTCFPVYRSYLPAGRQHLDEAFAAARTSRPDLGPAYDALEGVLSDPEQPAARRFQQTSGMVMAKGVEDCAFYRYARLTSLNEVGGDPSVFSVPVGDFHAAMVERQRDWPHAMTAGTTHDTKRGEDTRARIAVLAELPEVWSTHLARLQELAPVSDPAFASLLWQAVLGVWPASRERLHGYAEKAMREAGDHTTWTDPDEAFEAEVHRAVDAAYDVHEVAAELDALLARVVEPGWSNALSAKLLSLTAPGVPDVYQGSELWELNLVDPDNRAPVDFDLRRAVLAGTAQDPAAVKLHLVGSVLRLRRARPELFSAYTPLEASGHAAEHVVAFDRGGAIAVATRLPVGLAEAGGWRDTELTLPKGEWVDALTGRPASSSLAELLARHPVALLVPASVPAS